ncbi:MAG: hypothetical protein JOZ62_12690, partial [Acidobacteriaceae bacterium]|nr:hypothetical protein [Acidobacteriaceae bacterium]
MHFPPKSSAAVVCGISAGLMIGVAISQRSAARVQAAAAPTAKLNLLPGMPPLKDPKNIYAADKPGMLSPAVRQYPSLIYVPNSKSDSVDIIDPATCKIVHHFA